VAVFLITRCLDCWLLSKHGKFIINADDWTAPGVDDSGQKRQSVWINNSTNICPTGFSLPTLEELRAEINGSRGTWTRKIGISGSILNNKMFRLLASL
jgi:hypothetical protein